MSTLASAHKRFFRAAEAGSVSGMQEACDAGANPRSLTERGANSAWYLVVAHAPFHSMKTCFTFLKKQDVPIFCYSPGQSNTHPALLLLNGCAHLSSLESARMFWRLWSYMSAEEQNCVLKEDDIKTSVIEHSESYTAWRSDRIYDVWTLPRDEHIPFGSPAYRSYGDHVARAFSFGGSRSPFLTKESLFVFLRSLPMSDIEGHMIGFDTTKVWGALCATAPIATLKACVATPHIRDLIQYRIASSLKELKEEDSTPTAPVLSLNQTYVHILKRCHKAGLRWPDQWPASTQEALLALPEVRLWTDQRALKLSLPSTTLKSALRVRV